MHSLRLSSKYTSYIYRSGKASYILEELIEFTTILSRTEVPGLEMIMRSSKENTPLVEVTVLDFRSSTSYAS